MAIGGGLLPPLVAELVMDVDKFAAGAVKAQATASGLADSTKAMFTKVGKGAALAFAGIAVASVAMATSFDTQMARLYTAAGAPKAAVQQATGQVLALGNAVGVSGTQIAEALYHPVSAGLDLSTSLQAVKYSAEEAQISGASLDDTTYALSSVMKSFNVSASGAHDEMAMLNAIVGEGDMRFQDLNASVPNWAPMAAQMGMSVRTMGAGLDYLTDRGNSAESAATRLTMGLAMMTTPSKQAATLLEGMGDASSDVTASSQAMTQVLQKTGITQNELAADLAKPDGIYVALTHLKTSLHDAGVEGTEADSVLAKIFGGGRSDKAIMSLMQNLDGLKTKYDDIGAAAGNFDQAWKDTQQTFGFKMKQLEAETENLAISFGNKLIPMLSATVTWFNNNQWAVVALAVVIGGTLTVAAVMYAQKLLGTLLTAIAKTIVGIKSMGDTSEEAAAKQEASAATAERWGKSLGNAIPIIGGVVAGAIALGNKMDDWTGESGKATLSTDQLTKAALSGANGIKDFGYNIDQATGVLKQMGVANTQSLVPMADLGVELGKLSQEGFNTSDQLQKYDAMLANLTSSGHSEQAQAIVTELSGAVDAQGKKILNTARDLPQYYAALASAAAQQALTGDATDANTNAVDANSVAMDQNAKSIGQAVDAGQSLADAVNSVSDAYDALSANLTSSGALLAFRKDLLSVTDEVNKNGKAFNQNSLDGIANMQAFQSAAKEILDYRDAQLKAAGGTKASDDAIQAINKTSADQAQQLLGVWEQVTGNKTAVDAYAKSIGLVPKDLTTTVTTPGLSSALSGLQQLAQAAGAPIGRGGSRVQTNAAGGYITGAGTGTSDSILSWLSNGEYVVSAAAVSAVGRPFLDALNSSGGRGASLGGVGGGSSVMGAMGMGTPIVQVFLDGKPVGNAVQRVSLRRDLRNSSNGLSLSGSGLR